MPSAETDVFVWEQTLRGLDRQATVLSELRQRASIVLSATGQPPAREYARAYARHTLRHSTG